jgi:hypothetical protein
MKTRIGTFIFCSAILAAGTAQAGTSYAFKVENGTSGPLSITVDAKSVCSLAAGETCTVSLPDEDAHAYAYAAADGTAVAFSPGNLEAVDLCKIEASGAHCTDAMGAATN